MKKEAFVVTTKSDYLGGIIQEEIRYSQMTAAQQKKYPEGKTWQQMGESIIGSYLTDMLYAGYREDVSLDMTYGSIRHLPLAMRSNLQSLVDGGRTLQKAADSAARTLAAYLFAVGMNEHDTKLTVEAKRTPISKADPDEGPLWANMFRITTGTRYERDLLIPALEGGSGMTREGKGLMLMAVGPLIRAYKAAFGVDLSEHGLADMALEVELQK